MMTRRELLLGGLAGTAALTARSAPALSMEGAAGTILLDRSIFRSKVAARHPGIVVLDGPVIEHRLIAMFRGRSVAALLSPANHILLIELLRDLSVVRLVQRIPLAADLDAIGTVPAAVLPTTRLVEFQIA